MRCLEEPSVLHNSNDLERCILIDLWVRVVKVKVYVDHALRENARMRPDLQTRRIKEQDSRHRFPRRRSLAPGPSAFA